MNFKPLYLLPLLLVCMQACNMINPKESIPTYIVIDSVQVLPTAPTVHGTVSQKVRDVWVYYNLHLLGAFQLPARIPVIATSRGQLQIIAGIWDNGISGLRSKYPFYTVDTFSFDPSPKGFIHHTPVFNYRTTDNPPTYFVEDFEQGNSFQRLNGDTTFVKTNTPEDVFEGSWSDKLELKDTITYGECISVQEYTIPTDKMSYVELNYKNDIPFTFKIEVNLNGTKTQYDLGGINTSLNWNKIYFNLGSFIASYPKATFKFLFTAQLPSGVSQAKVLIDNFKIIHFN